MTTPTPPRTLAVVFDTDPGIDDALGLLMLARHPGVDLLGVTTVFGNADIETTTRNARALCELYAVTVPVARGAKGPLRGGEPSYPVEVHGANGLGGLLLPEPSRPCDPRAAHALICDAAASHPHELTLIAVGPLTNLALALQADACLAHKVKQVVVMGGAFGGHGHTGNVSPVAEANIAADPHAADLVFQATWPVSIVGLDVTQQVVLQGTRMEAWRRRGDRVGTALWEATRVYHRWYQKRDGIDGVYLHDPSAVACAIDPALFEQRRGPVRVMTEGPACGQTLQVTQPGRYPPNAWTGSSPQQVCTSVDVGKVLALVDRLLAA